MQMSIEKCKNCGYVKKLMALGSPKPEWLCPVTGERLVINKCPYEQ